MKMVNLSKQNSIALLIIQQNKMNDKNKKFIIFCIKIILSFLISEMSEDILMQN